MFIARYFFRSVGVFLSVLSAPGLSANECAGGGSEGCWASACVLTPEGLFLEGKSVDGWRRAEYIFPLEGPFRYRTRWFFDDKCTQSVPGETGPWVTSEISFERARVETPLESTRIEHIVFNPVDWGRQPNQVISGRLTITDNVRLCFSSNLPFAEDGPAYDLQPLPADGSGDVSSTCLDRMMGLDVAEPETRVDLTGMEVPPYPEGYDSWQGNCVEFSGGATFGCNWTISILSASSDTRPVGVFSAQTLRYEGPMPVAKVTDYLEYPQVPEGYVFAHFECAVNGTDDSAVVAVVKISNSEWFGEGIWARRLNITTGRFEEIDPAKVRCVSQGLGEGHLPEDGDLQFLP